MMSEKEESEDGIAGYIKPNVGLMLWLLLLGFGGGLLALYYASIGYFPDIKWEESLTYLMVLSIFGGALVLAYGLMIFIPGVIWSDFLIFDPKFKRCLCYIGAKGEEPCVMAILQRLVLPFVIFILPIHWLPVSITMGSAALGVVFLIFACVVAYWINKKDMFQGKGFWSLGSAPGRFLTFFVLSALSSWVALGLVRWMLLQQECSSREPMKIVCTAMIIFANIFVSLQYRQRRVGAYLSGIIVAALLLVFGHLLANGCRQTPSARFMSAFGIGYGHMVTVVVSRAGAEIFQYHGIQSMQRTSLQPPTKTLASTDSGTKGMEEPAFTIKGLEMLSRLGSDYYLHSSACGKVVSIPKKFVLSWSYDDAEDDAGMSGNKRYAGPPKTSQPQCTPAPASPDAEQSTTSIGAASPVATPAPGKP